MGTKHKELYEAPSVKVFEVKTEGVICQSVYGGNAGLGNYGWFDQNNGTGMQDYGWNNIPLE